MENKRMGKRGVLLLLSVAILIVGIVVVLTVVGSAGDAGDRIGNFSYQTLSGASVGDGSTDLRFLFTVDSLEYSRAGFVFSKTNKNPTVGGSGCTVRDTTAVYSAVRANGNLIEAPNGRYWVAVKMTNIPHASFSTPIYVRPFVQKGGEILYADAKDLSTCEALGHDNLTLGKILAAPTLSDKGEQEYHCDICGDFVDDVDADAYASGIETYQALAAGFTSSDFASGSITSNLGNGTNYNYLAKHPTQGQHPRVMFTASEVPGIRTALANASSTLKNDYYDATFSDPPDGDIGSAEDRNDGYHNFEGLEMNDIQMLALDYQVTGNKISGYRAIYAIKNYLKTMDFQEISGDQCRQFGFVMYNTACVYDWCYDLLTSSDKQQIVLAVQKKCCEGSNSSGARMEVGFPPSGQNAVSGHGCEYQILRDYLAFAIAIYDEYPGWWNYVAERIYDEYVPVRNVWYEAGMVPQGVSLYVRIRFDSDMFSALLLKAATGEIPYDTEGMRQVLHTVYSYELPTINSTRNCFESGDNKPNDRGFQDFGRAALIASHLFNDRVLRSQFQKGKNGYSQFSSSFTVVASQAECLICSSSGVVMTNSRHEGEPKIVYSGGWLGQIIARDAWDDTQAATLMKIGCRTAANHDHADAGQFQIWYLGMLAGDTGSYDKYGDTHFTNYHQATIAHNSLLIKKGTGTYNVGNQKKPSESGSYNNWMTDTYKTGTVTGYQYGYSDQAQTTPAYAYIAGNITPAYDNSRATEVTRRMLTVFDTSDPNEELYFFVFDNITATSGSYKKTFLLHVPNEPTIDGKKVTVVNDQGGKMVLQNVFGGDNIEGIGGANRNYLVNGSQINPTNSTDDGYWGRVEISPNTGSTTNQLLNVMYVCDETDPTDLTATAISNSTVKGAVLGNTAAVFIISAARRTTQFDFENGAAAGTYKYYISGVAAGDWIVSVGGTPVGIARATEEGGLLVFTAPAGTVTLTPRGEGGLAWDGLLGEIGWTEIDFSLLP